MNTTYRLALCPALLIGALGASTLLSGCASGPKGGVTVLAPNRLQASLTVARTINPDYYYGVAIDDVPGDTIGPVGIEGNTVVQNGVVGGNWRLLVLWHNNVFQVYRRRTPTDPATEERLLTSPFLGSPRASGSTIEFTLDLDAKLGDGTYLLPHTADAIPQLAADRVQLNAVTTNTILRDPSDNRVKPVDTLGPQAIASPVFEFQVNATRSTDLPDDSGDIRFGVDTSFTTGPGQVTFNQMDITNLRIGIVRG